MNTETGDKIRNGGTLVTEVVHFLTYHNSSTTLHFKLLSFNETMHAYSDQELQGNE